MRGVRQGEGCGVGVGPSGFSMGVPYNGPVAMVQHQHTTRGTKRLSPSLPPSAPPSCHTSLLQPLPQPSKAAGRPPPHLTSAHKQTHSASHNGHKAPAPCTWNTQRDQAFILASFLKGHSCWQPHPKVLLKEDTRHSIHSRQKTEDRRKQTLTFVQGTHVTQYARPQAAPHSLCCDCGGEMGDAGGRVRLAGRHLRALLHQLQQRGVRPPLYAVHYSRGCRSWDGVGDGVGGELV